MPRRRELQSIATDMAHFCVGRNNDIEGYWALGVLCRHADETSQRNLAIRVSSALQFPYPVEEARRNLLERFDALDVRLRSYVKSISVNFSFEPLSLTEVFGQEFRSCCWVMIVDDRGTMRHGEACEICWPHEPEWEMRSSRVGKVRPAGGLPHFES